MVVFDKDHFVMPGHATCDKNKTENNNGKQQFFILSAPFQPTVGFFFSAFYKIMEAVHKYGAEKYQQEVPVE